MGGICGDQRNKNESISTVSNCYNVAQVTIGTPKDTNKIGMITGQQNKDVIATLCYYSESSEIPGIGYGGYGGTALKSKEEMQSKSFVDLLNQNAEGVIWKEDTGINNGYPILSCQ